MPTLRLATFNCENLFARFKFNKNIEPTKVSKNGFTINDVHFDFLKNAEKSLTADAIRAVDANVIALQACAKAFKKALAREPALAVHELRKLDTARSEELYMNLQPAIRRGSPRAVEVGIKLLDHTARINGYAAPQKHELTGKELEEVDAAIDRLLAQLTGKSSGRGSL